jgi:hypothetical protein
MQGKGMLEATVCVNRANLDFDVNALSSGEDATYPSDSAQLDYLEDD